MVKALKTCATAKVSGMIFNIGAEASFTLNELAQEIGVRPQYLPERVQEVKEAIADHSKAKKYLRYQDKTSLRDGIAKTWSWAREMGPQKLEYTSIEISSSKIPKNWL
ncbi:MAG: hypothetical protein M1365_06185 [Actinobacteria bacterium]|nr:hypothetical protein [Actinomycetota bacterium]